MDSASIHAEGLVYMLQRSIYCNTISLGHLMYEYSGVSSFQTLKAFPSLNAHILETNPLAVVIVK